jgi:tRNA G10  N-methylase Trm11
LRFGPEVGVGKFKSDALVVSSWLAEVRKIANDLQSVEGKSFCHSQVHLADARNIPNLLKPHSIDTVITSPPYPNEKDYTRTTRLESVLLEFYTTKAELQTLKKNLLRSNTRGVYVTDDDDKWVKPISSSWCISGICRWGPSLLPAGANSYR